MRVRVCRWPVVVCESLYERVREREKGGRLRGEGEG